MKAYQIEAKRLLDDVIEQNKEDKAVSSLIMSKLKIIVKYRRGTRRRSISRPSHTNGKITPK